MDPHKEDKAKPVKQNLAAIAVRKEKLQILQQNQQHSGRGEELFHGKDKQVCEDGAARDA